jgi:choline dehydrogenase
MSQQSRRQVTANADYLIIGAGSSGCVIANRLSQNPDRTVCLLEAGGPDRDAAIHQPSQIFSLFGSPVDWAYMSEPQMGLNQRSIFTSQGKVLGGTSSLNAMIYTRGNRADFDGWKALGNEGWSYDEVLPYFIKSEKFRGAASTFHGIDGELSVRPCPNPSPVASAFVRSGEILGYDTDRDFNGAEQANGTGLFQLTVTADGHRSSAAAAFLTPILGRSNLTVTTGATVTRILIENGKAIGVEYLQDGELRRIYANQEVILSAGAIASPQILMRSGIGAADALAAHQIPVQVDLPGVGQNLQDHLTLVLLHQSKQALPPSEFLGEAGLFVQTGSDRDSEAPDLECMCTGNMRALIPPDSGIGFPVFFLAPVLLNPMSRGTVQLRSADPQAAPIIDPNYLSDDRDLSVLLYGLELAQDLANTPEMLEFNGGELAPGLGASPAQLREFIRAQATTVWHPVGTCKMGQDPMAVVDAELKVHGVVGLRVADASIMPTIIRGHPNAACIMIGEKLAAMIG